MYQKHCGQKISNWKEQLDADEIAYQKANESYQHEILAAKIRYEQNLANSIKTNCRKFYNHAKRFTRPQSSVVALEYNRKLFTQNSDKADILSKFLVTVNEPDTLPHFKYKSAHPSQCIYGLNFSQEDISKSCQNSNPTKRLDQMAYVRMYSKRY